MNWPRGKYNGKKIVGFELGMKVNFSWWNWIPRKVAYSGLIHWLCFTFRFEAVYK